MITIPMHFWPVERSCKYWVKFCKVQPKAFPELYNKTETMKTLPKSLVYAALASTLALGSSCKKDASDNVELPADGMMLNDTLMNPVDTSDTDTVFPADGTTSKAVGSTDMGSGKSTSQGTAATSKKNQSSKSPTSAKDKNGQSLDGYSAPDGTDAENNDGDQYTKNDTRRMPSGGTSIK